MEEAPIIGIDLGTTCCCMSVLQHGDPRIIPIDGCNTMASCVSFNNQDRTIGNKALEDSILNPFNTVHGVKRFIGCRFDDKELQDNNDLFLYEIINDNGFPKIKVNYMGEDKIFAPEEISAMFLSKMKEVAEQFFDNRTVCKTVITVPAQFKDNQRQATRDAGKIAGLDVVRIINEPTAASMAFGIQKKYLNEERERNVLVYDFGGGTFDVSIIKIEGGIFEVKATSGNNHLGGNDIDDCLVKHFESLWNEKNSEDPLSNNRRALRRLRVQCEKVKKELSEKNSVNIIVDQLIKDKDLMMEITKNQFDNLIRDIVERSLTYVQNALNDSHLDKTDIDDILMVGGSSRIPLVRKLLQEFFNGKELNTSLNPEEAVAIGAAVQASIIADEEGQTSGTLLLLDVTSLSLGIETSGGIFTELISRNTQIPTRMTKKFANEVDNQTRVKIVVYEGERKLVADNNKLGEFALLGITPRPRGKTLISVTFEINNDGILTLTADEINDEGKENQLKVEVNKGNLSEYVINQMIQQAQEFQEQDMRRKEIINSKIALESACSDAKYKGEKFVHDVDDRNKIIELYKETMAWIQTEQVDKKETYDIKKLEVNAKFRSIFNQYL